MVEVYRHLVLSFQSRSRAWIKARFPGRVRSGMENLEAIVRAYLGLAGQNSTRPRAMHLMWAESFSSVPELREEVRALNARSLAGIAEQLHAGIRRGEIDPDVDVESLAIAILGLLRGATAQYLLEPETVDIERLSNTIVAMLRGGITTRQPVSAPTETS